MYEVLKDLNLYALSLRVKFTDLTANFSKDTSMHYQQAYSTTGSLFIQGFISTKIQRIVWKPNRVSRGDHTIEKEHKKSSRLK